MVNTSNSHTEDAVISSAVSDALALSWRLVDGAQMRDDIIHIVPHGEGPTAHGNILYHQHSKDDCRREHEAHASETSAGTRSSSDT